MDGMLHVSHPCEKRALLDAGGAVELVTHGSSGMACCPAGQSSADNLGSSAAMLRVAVTESPSWTCSVITHSLLACSGPQAMTLPSDLAPSTHGNTLQVILQVLFQTRSYSAPSWTLTCCHLSPH